MPRIACQHPRQDRINNEWNPRHQVAGGGVKADALLFDHVKVILAGERQLAGDQVIQSCTQGEDVAAIVRLPRIHRLLVGHVVRRAERLPRGSQSAGLIGAFGFPLGCRWIRHGSWASAQS